MSFLLYYTYTERGFYLMNLLELVTKNRSYRTFDESVLVSKEQLEELVNLARLCPSGSNRQALKFFLSYDKETNDVIQPLTYWAALLAKSGVQLPPVGHCPTAFIVICCDKNIVENPDFCNKDIGIVAQTMLLGAASMDLGGCMVGNFNSNKLQDALELPEHIIPTLVIGLGKPEENIQIVSATELGTTNYYRDEQNNHYVPKRDLDELIISN